MKEAKNEAREVEGKKEKTHFFYLLVIFKETESER